MPTIQELKERIDLLTEKVEVNHGESEPLQGPEGWPHKRVVSTVERKGRKGQHKYTISSYEESGEWGGGSTTFIHRGDLPEKGDMRNSEMVGMVVHGHRNKKFDKHHQDVVDSFSQGLGGQKHTGKHEWAYLSGRAHRPRTHRRW